MRFWDLPGAIRYLGDVEQALRLGENVVVRFPNMLPTGFVDAIWSALDGCGLRFTHLTGGGEPEKVLSERFLAGMLKGEDVLGTLCKAGHFAERLIFLEVAGSQWEPWGEFLEGYARASRATPIEQRSVFIVAVGGMPYRARPTADVAKVFEWDDVIDEADILAFANDSLRRKGRTRPIARLLASVVSSLAAWDFDTASRLIEERDRTILQPVEMLRSWGRERGWDERTAISWDLGTASMAGTPHAARSAMDEPPIEIYRRLWIAQASVLLPKIEARRASIVEDNFDDLRRWLVRADQSERDPYDLEIGELHGLFQDRGGRYALRREISNLRRARNALAHVDPVQPAVALELLN